LVPHFALSLKLDRLRLRGPNGAKDEFLLAATAQNLRKLAKATEAGEIRYFSPNGVSMRRQSKSPLALIAKILRLHPHTPTERRSRGYLSDFRFNWRASFALAPQLSSLFPEFYNRALERRVDAKKTEGITQAVLAEKLGRPQSFVAKYEGREHRLDVADFVGIARALGADPLKLRASER
jgi:hypothetical protein